MLMKYFSKCATVPVQLKFEKRVGPAIKMKNEED